MRIVSCTRAEAEAELTNMVDSCLVGIPLKAEAMLALPLLRGGMEVVKVGHTIYAIQEAQAS